MTESSFAPLARRIEFEGMQIFLFTSLEEGVWARIS